MTDPRHRWSSLIAFCQEFATTAPRQVAIAIVVAIALGLTDGIAAMLLLPLLEATGVDVAQGGIGRLAGYVSRGFAMLHVHPTLGTALTLFVGITVARSFLVQWKTLASARAGNALAVVMRTRLYSSIARANWLVLAKTRSGDLTHVLTDELSRVTVTTHELLNIVSGTVVSLVYIALAMRVSAVMTSAVLVCGGVLLGILAPRVSKSRRDGRQISKASNRLYGAISEHIASLRTAKSYGAEGRHIESMAEISREISTVEIAASRTYATSQQLLEIGSVVALAALVYVGLRQFALAPGAVLMMVYLVARIMPRLAALQNSVQVIAHHLPSFEAVVALQERLDAHQEQRHPATEQIQLNDCIQMQHVRFAYDSVDRPVLEDFTLEIRRGTIAAIVGPSGAGKSTVADLLTGLQRPQSGHVAVDGRILDDSLISAWREEIGYVSQETFIFDDTVRGNLLWAKPGASVDDIAAALRMAKAEFVFNLEQGLDTVLGERGVRLSGGERQRLALARALLRRPQLLVLDEPTSSLDVENERHILDALERMRGQVTTLLITHRLSAVRRADVIHVLEGGRLVESGPWKVLDESLTSRFRALADAMDGVPDLVKIEN